MHQHFNNFLMLFTKLLFQDLIKHLIILGSLSFVHIHTFSQSYHLATEIPVRKLNGDTLTNAWSGGLETPQYGSVDLNRDGVLDLVAFDKEASRFVTFLNTGSENEVNFRYDPSYQRLFDNCPCITWALFEDANCDGLPDLLCRTDNSDASVFEQRIAADSILFELTYPELNVQRGNLTSVLSVNPTDIPGLKDLDYDGDLDFLVFGVNATTVTYIKNMAVENTGRCDTFLLVRDTQCWGHFRESDVDNTAFVADTISCPFTSDFRPRIRSLFQSREVTYENVANGVTGTRDILHAGSTTLLLDLNADSTYDALIGDTSFDEIYALYNSGTIDYAFMDSVERNFPSLDTSISISTFPSAFYLDINNDGVRDLIAAPHASSSFDNVTGTWLYLNVGADNKPDFQLSERGFLQNTTLDVGSYAFPSFIDYNNDGLQDLIVGNLGYFNADSPILEPAIALLENTGTNAFPTYEIRTLDMLDLRSTNDFPLLTEISPAGGDLNGDGRDDLLLGNTMGTLYFFQHNGMNTTNPFEFVTDTLGGIDVGRNSAPFLYDIDEDEDLDLFIGNVDGYIHFYENKGISEEVIPAGLPEFELISETWGNIRILDEFGGEFSRGFARPTLADYDKDGEAELLVGGVVGEVEIYEFVNQRVSDSLVFSGVLANHDFGVRAAPAVAVTDTSNSPIFVVGNIQGGLQLVVPDSFGIITSTEKNLSTPKSFDIFPNPTSSQITIHSLDNQIRPANISIYDLSGKLNYQDGILHYPKKLDLSFLSPGYYYLTITHSSGREVFKVLKY